MVQAGRAFGPPLRGAGRRRAHSARDTRTKYPRSVVDPISLP
jgi:hypothetical protein